LPEQVNQSQVQDRAAYVHVVSRSEFPIVPSYPHYPHRSGAPDLADWELQTPVGTWPVQRHTACRDEGIGVNSFGGDQELWATPPFRAVGRSAVGWGCTPPCHTPCPPTECRWEARWADPRPTACRDIAGRGKVRWADPQPTPCLPTACRSEARWVGRETRWADHRPTAWARWEPQADTAFLPTACSGQARSCPCREAFPRATLPHATRGDIHFASLSNLVDVPLIGTIGGWIGANRFGGAQELWAS